MRKLISILFITMVGFLLFGCSSESNSDQGNTEGNAEGNADQVTVEVALPEGYAYTPEEIIEGFREEHPNINLEVIETPWAAFSEKIVTQVASGTAPDVWWKETGNILAMGERGAAEDLAPYIEESDLNENDYNQLFAAEDPEGHVWGIPHDINPVALAYNKDLFDEAGVDYPTADWTYEDLIEASKKLTTENTYGFENGYQITEGYFPWIHSYGGSMLNSERTESNFNDPNTIAGIEAWSDMVNELEVSPTYSRIQAGGKFGNVFDSGNAAMRFMQLGAAMQTREKLDAAWDTVMMPKGIDGQRIVPSVVNSWMINASADQEVKDAAWEFLKYTLSKEAQLALGNNSPLTPVNKEALAAWVETYKENGRKPQNIEAYTQGMAEGAIGLEENPTWAEWKNEAEAVLMEVYKGNLSPEEGAEEAHQKVQEILENSQ